MNGKNAGLLRRSAERNSRRPKASISNPPGRRAPDRTLTPPEPGAQVAMRPVSCRVQIPSRFDR
jgi:hypothetical protein